MQANKNNSSREISVLSDKQSKAIILGLGLTFVTLNAYLISREIEVLNLLPVILAITLAFIFQPKLLFFLTIGLTPLSIPLSEFFPGIEFNLWFPTELAISIFFILIIIKSFWDLHVEKTLLNKGIFWAIIFYLGWLIVSTISSEMPIVSVKYTLLRIIYLTVFFYLPYNLFLQKTKNYAKFFAFFLTGLTVVIFISITKQASRGLFDKFVAHGACNPYFTDHTSYGAALAFVIPISFAFAFTAKKQLIQIGLFLLSTFFLAALILSYSRAAWLSLIVAFIVWIIWLLRIKLKTLFLISAVSVLLAFSFQNSIIQWFENNTTASSGDIRQHIRSIVNIKTDESNVERLNRWTCAIRMFNEKPFLGWGPGTYMFQYSPFQSSYLKTRESSDLGQKGNAHSEYLGLLSEAGWPAAMCFSLIIIFAITYAFRAIAKLKVGSKKRIWLLGAVLGLITYATHAFMNNFLDMDKVAAIFWGSIAFITAVSSKLDQKNSQKKSNPKIEMSSKI